MPHKVAHTGHPEIPTRGVSISRVTSCSQPTASRLMADYSPGLLLSPWLRTDLLLTSAAVESYSRNVLPYGHVMRLNLRQISCHGQGEAAASRRRFNYRPRSSCSRPRVTTECSGQTHGRSHGSTSDFGLTARNSAKFSNLKFFQKVRFSPILSFAIFTGSHGHTAMLSALPCSRTTHIFLRLSRCQAGSDPSFRLCVLQPQTSHACHRLRLHSPCQAPVMAEPKPCHDLSMRLRHSPPRLHPAMATPKPCSAVTKCAIPWPIFRKALTKCCVSTACHKATFSVETCTVKSVGNTGFACHFSTLLNSSTKFRATPPHFFNTDFPYISMLFA